MTDTITITKVDEVYNKITCEPGIAYELNEYFTFEVPGAKFMPAVRNKFWDGKIRLLNLQTNRIYHGLVPYIQKFADERQYKVEVESDVIATENFSIKEAKEFISTLDLPHEPRDYQINAFVHAIRNKRILLLSPTASGK